MHLISGANAPKAGLRSIGSGRTLMSGFNSPYRWWILAGSTEIVGGETADRYSVSDGWAVAAGAEIEVVELGFAAEPKWRFIDKLRI